MTFRKLVFIGASFIFLISLLWFYRKPPALEVYDINKSFLNGQIAIKNLTLISSGNDVYLDDSYYFSVQLTGLSRIKLQIADAQERPFYSQETPIFFEEDGSQTYWSDPAFVSTEMIIPAVKIRHRDTIYLNIHFEDESGREYNETQPFNLKKKELIRTKP